MQLREKELFLAQLKKRIREDEWLGKVLISVIVFGSFLHDEWDPARSDLDLFFYVRRRRDKRMVFEKALAMLDELNKEFRVYPLHGVTEGFLDRVNAAVEYAVIVPLFFSGFHVICFSRGDYCIEENRARNPIFRFFKRHIFSPALFLENIKGDYEVLYGEDVLAHIHHLDVPDLGRALVFPSALLWYVIPFLALKPRYALGWTIKSSRLAEHYLRCYDKVMHQRFLLSSRERAHRDRTLALRRNFYYTDISIRELWQYYLDSWRFISGIKRHSKKS